MEKYIDQIRYDIESLPLNYVFIAKDFTKDIDYETARKTLRRLNEKGEIKKIDRGYYYKAALLPIINDYSRPDLDSYAKAIARNMNWKIFPSGNTALNAFGLSTQVPANYSYISSGRTITYKINKSFISFTHRTSRETDLSYITGALIQALKALGSDNINDDILLKLSKTLSESDKEIILQESKMSSAWIYEIIKKICKGETK